jgi:hypothetical protein
MSRPVSTREALSFRPPVQACRADTSCVERIPRIPTSARPKIFLPGRPAAEGAANARAGRAFSDVEAGFVFDYDRRVVIRCRTHAPILRNKADVSVGENRVFVRVLGGKQVSATTVFQYQYALIHAMRLSVGRSRN